MGKISTTTHQQSAPGAWQAIAPSDEGSDRLFSCSEEEECDRFLPVNLAELPPPPALNMKAIIYELHLVNAGVPDALSKCWAECLAAAVTSNDYSQADRLMHGLYCYFVGRSHG